MTSDDAGLIDWELAVRSGARLVPAGPGVTPQVAHEVVAQLRREAARAAEFVRDYTGLVALTDADSVRVIDRPGWIEANVAAFRTLVGPLEYRVRDARPRPGGLAEVVTPKVAGAQTGALLAFLATRVLGQYELLPVAQDGSAAAGLPPGRLLLVAPNVVAVEQALGVDPDDFRLWVCLHEETHRAQFGAVPWLRSYLLGEIRAYLDATELEPAALASRLRDGLAALARSLVRVTKGENAEDVPSLLEAVQTPAQREILDRLTAVMSLVEGHADVVMDGVGPEVIPTVATIRARFQRRRSAHGLLDVLIRQLLGLDAKMRQYRDGATFVHGVVDQVGREGFDAVWAGPDNLPRVTELTEPSAWVSRVHG